MNTNHKEILSNVEFYKYLSPDEEKIIEQGIRMREYAKGEQIHDSSAGGCSGVLIVVSGKIRAYILSEEGREVTLYYLESGDTCILTASCVMSCLAFEVHIEAEENTSVIQIISSAFAKVLENNVRVENFALKLAVDRFSDVMWALQQILFFSMDKRLAMYIYNEVSKTKSNELSVTHEQIAKSLGSAREVVTRLLQQFHKQGIVELSRGKITVLDIQKISDLCD